MLPTANPPTATSATVNKPNATDIVATYQVSGGIAGINDVLTVRGDRSLELKKSRPITTIQGQATDEQFNELQRILNDPKFAELQSQYGQNQCCDMFTYVITINGKTITTYDGAESPEVVGNLINVLGEMKNSVK